MGTEIESTARTIVRFAAFQVDLNKGVIFKHGLRIKLQDQPFRILVALLERAGDVVPRDQLQERIWGKDTFVDFDHGLSAAVNRLREALGDSAESPRYIETVARRGYRFIAALEVDAVAADVPAKKPESGSKRKLYWLAGAAVALACLAGAALWLKSGGSAKDPMQLVQITALSGSETMPSLSPDGKQLAYVWNGEDERNADIYLQIVGSEQTLRLTSHPGADLLPSWSPDGGDIAFVRISGKTEIFLVSRLGGPERKLIELPGTDRRLPGPETRIVGDLLYPIVGRPSWSPDGKYLAITRYSEPPEAGDGAVLLVPIDGGPVETIMTASPGTWYKHPVFSSDGRQLAFARCEGMAATNANCQLQVVSLGAGFRPKSEPRTLIPIRGQLRGLDWVDGASLIVSGFSLPHFYSWRVSTDNVAAPERLEMAGADAIWPSFSRTGRRLAFSRSILQADIFRLEKGHKPSVFLSSTTRDISPQFSEDGTRIAFESSRSGEMNIWLAQADGSKLRQLTRKLGHQTSSPRWSPDGKQIALNAGRVGGENAIWVVDVESGWPKKLTPSPGRQSNPTWSRDGKKIYYASKDSGRVEIWRMNAEGGEAKQITRSGAVVGVESSDGKTLYILKGSDGGAGLFAHSLEGGAEQQLFADPVIRFSYAVVEEGIYYVTPSDEDHCEIRFHEFATGRQLVIERIERPIAFGLSVSPDRKTFLYSKPITGADLMMIENFR